MTQSPVIVNLQGRAVVSKRTEVKRASTERTLTGESAATTLVQRGTFLLSVRKARTMLANRRIVEWAGQAQWVRARDESGTQASIRTAAGAIRVVLF